MAFISIVSVAKKPFKYDNKYFQITCRNAQIYLYIYRYTYSPLVFSALDSMQSNFCMDYH